MKNWLKFSTVPTRLIYFQAPPNGSWDRPEWAPDPERNKQKALKKLIQLAQQTKIKSLQNCLHTLVQFIQDQLKDEIADNPMLKDLFIKRLCGLETKIIATEISRAYTRLITRPDFDLKSASEVNYLAAFLMCWLEIIKESN